MNDLKLYEVSAEYISYLRSVERYVFSAKDVPSSELILYDVENR